MQPIIQCVPNFSEGRDLDVVESIVDAARHASSARVIDYSSDPDHNRMVLTLLGGPNEIRASVFAAAKQAVESIDMRNHTGVHPRIGAVDVIPLVPIQDIAMDECVNLSRLIGNDLASSLGIPVYFYENSALMTAHAKLPDIRRGGFEALASGTLEATRTPDLGPHLIHPSAGATVVGARGPLVAYNIILESTDLDLARLIARKLRNGESGLQGIKSIGLWLASRSQIQVSMNLTQPDLTPLLDVFTFVRSEAHSAGIKVAESEIIGALFRRHLEGTSPDQLEAFHFKESQILDNWI